ncbi:hypothetical protein ACFFK0_23565 [Paenibacillus chartarius]|uniref:Uncharacterized protein n=1 Tax=Paenibacillus chartarius TaxID=747481 RepID=A0ABV6DRV4_9BACL
MNMLDYYHMEKMYEFAKRERSKAANEFWKRAAAEKLEENGAQTGAIAAGTKEVNVK